MQRQITSASLALAGLGLIWGSNFIFMRWAAALISPLQIVCLWVLFGFLPILALALYRGAVRARELTSPECARDDRHLRRGLRLERAVRAAQPNAMTRR